MTYYAKSHSIYRGFHIERNLMPGYRLKWNAWDFIDGYCVRLSADTLGGIRQLIRESV